MNAEKTASMTGLPLWLEQLPTRWPGQGDLIQWWQTMGPGAAALLVLGGIVYLLFGYWAFKWLVTLNAAFAGAYVGAMVGQRGGNSVAGACVGGFLLAAIAWPMMKYAVALMGGVFGAALGASLWRTAGLEPHLAWAGALTGLIGFGLISFIVFRASVMMYTSLQGSVMLIFGILGLIYKYREIGPQVTEHMTLKPFMLPIAIFIPALLGIIFQQTLYQDPEAEKDD